MKLKILQINKFYYLRGGSERYVFSVSKLLEERGHTVIPFSMYDKENKISKYNKYFIDYIDLHKFSIKNIVKFFYNYDAIRRLKKLIKKEKPDIAHLHNIAHQLTPAIINLLKKNNIKIVQTLHDYKMICPNAKLYNKNGNCEKCLGGKYYNCFLNSCLHDSRAKSFLAMLEAYFYKKINKAYDKVDLFIAPSQFMKDVNVKFGIPEKKIEVLYNFLSNEWLNKAVETDCATSLHGERDKYILYFGRLSREKGIDTVLEAFSQMEYKKIKFLIAGSGPAEKEIRDKISELDLFDQVKLLGFQSGQKLDSLIIKATAIIMPSLWPENMPYSLLESLAMGKIVIASQVGGMTELIVNKSNGYLYQAEDSIELVEKINKLADLSQDELQKMTQKAKEKLSFFNTDSHYNDLFDIYKKVLKKS
jgi:glycosyltransferase involved in cell wall biosynthesis